MLLPGSTGAGRGELGYCGSKAGGGYRAGLPHAADNQLRKSATLSLPVAQVFCLPLWLNETDPKLFPASSHCRLNCAGCNHAAPTRRCSIGRLSRRRRRARSSWLACCPRRSTRSFTPKPTTPSISPRATIRFPENTLTIWREQDKLTMAITRGTSLVYYQSLGEGEITARVVQDISCAQVTLAMQDILMPLQKMLLWTAVTPAEITALKGALPLPIEQKKVSNGEVLPILASNS